VSGCVERGKGSGSFIKFHLVVSREEVNKGDNVASRKFLREFIRIWGKVSVTYCYLVDVDCIVDQAIPLVLFLNKKPWVAVGAFAELENPSG
jgi:hypothetical protein